MKRYSSTHTATRVTAFLLAFGLLGGMVPTGPAARAADAAPGATMTVPASDMKVAAAVYGWVTTDAVKTSDNRVSVSIMPAGGSEEATYTSAVIYGTSNVMTGADMARVITSRCTKGAFIEICLNAAGDVIDMRRVLQAGLNFDTAKYGGDLTEIGSTVSLRGGQYTDIYNENATGATGVYTGDSGPMVAYGWLLKKDASTITVGDGNLTTEVFNETYSVADDVKVYNVNNYIKSVNDGGTFASTPSDFASLTPSVLTGGNIYQAPSADRYQVVVIFDKDYTQYDSAKVVEIYEYTAHENVDKFVGNLPQSVRVGSDLSETTQGSPSPTSAAYLVSANPIEVVKGKMWTIGDIEDNCPVFKGGTDASMGKTDSDGDWLVQFDTGWPACGYQYMSNIAKVGLDPRDLDMLLVPHGHGDHYGALYDEWEMIVRAGGYPIVYESYEDTIGYDIYGFPSIQGIYDDDAVRSVITNWYPNDQWIDLGAGLNMMITLTPGHSQGCGSAVFQVTVSEKMEGAKNNYEQNSQGTWTNTYGDYDVGDEIFFAYMGGYGINGLATPTGSAAFRRDSFIASLRYIESVFSNMKTTTGDVPDGIYNLAQHTNQYPYTETALVMSEYNTANNTEYPFLRFMREGREEVINFCEKRASATLYSQYTSDYAAAYHGTDAQYSLDGAAAKAADSSPYYTYTAADNTSVRIKTDITSTGIFDNTVEDSGPFKHNGGETIIRIADDVDILVMHGYDVFLNKGCVPADANMTTLSQSTGIANENWNLSNGFAFAKDGFVYDPDAWYVQIGAHVGDTYNGCVYADNGEFLDGPVEAVRSNWCEMIRTDAMTKEQATSLAASLEKGAYYTVNLKKTGDIVNGSDPVTDTFTKIDDLQAKKLSEAGGELKSLPATGNTLAEQKPFHDALKNAEGRLEDYYKVVYSGYYDISMTLSQSSNTKINGEKDFDLRMYIPENSRYSQPTLFLMVPSGTDPYQFMVDSGWKETADRNSITVYLLMPSREKIDGVATAWGSWSAYSDAEIYTYIKAAVDVCGQRPGIQTVSYCFYGIGYGDAADYMTKYVMQNPTALAGAFSVGSNTSDSDLMDTLKAKPSGEAGVKVSEIAVPFGIVSDQADTSSVNAVIDYFKAANKTVSNAAVDGSFTYYAPDPDAETRQPDSEPCAGVYVSAASQASCMNAAFAQSVFDIFNTVRRYPGYQNTELRSYDDVYQDTAHYQYYTSLTALNRYTYGGDISAEGDGEYYNREWWVYVSDSAKGKMDAGTKVPVLFLFMGSNGYGDEIAQRTGWDQVADREGFIIVAPSGHVRHQGNFGNFDRNGVDVYQYCTNWNWTSGATDVIPDDLLMIDDIYQWLFNTTGSDFYGKVDASRVYASGQSAGGAFAHCVAKERPQYFAASAPGSWVDDGSNADTSSDVAMIVMMGQMDTTIKGALSTATAQKMFDNYIARYGSLKDANGRDSWSDFTFMQEPSGGTSVYTKNEGTFNEYILSTAGGVPMFVGLEVQGMTHATIPTECSWAWGLMSGFTKNTSNGALYYNNSAVDTPVTSRILNLNSDSGSSGGKTSTYTLTFSTNGGSAIAPVSKTSGSTVDLSAYVPTKAGFTFAGWYSDADLKQAVTSVKLTANTKVYAKWTQASAGSFTDVPASSYYHDAVLWAVEKGITNGTGPATFAPDTTCTRAQALTFLWRAMGSPEPTSTACPFTDVPADAYYLKAVLWGVENGITKGTGDTAFSPDAIMDRSQSVTLLWRAMGSHTSPAANPFTDVAEDAYYRQAVLWAGEEKITQGTGNALFSPLSSCTRAQLVTFLYRCMGR